MRRGIERREPRFRMKQKGFITKLRKHPTLAERILWQRLRNRNLDGLKFRRQHAIGQYIVDFYCDDLKLIIELDGGIHVCKKESDQDRQDELESLGYHVLRFKNQDVYQQILEVLNDIRKFRTKTGKHRIRSINCTFKSIN